MLETPTPDSPQHDALLLRRWVRDGSEAAFRALVERHLPMVWSTARRVVLGDEALAADIAQAVLADFAGKAHALPRDMPPAGWLHRHTVFTANKMLRSESRRRARERAAAPPPDAMPAPDFTWSELAPHLDSALDRLRESDRQAILLRYFEDRSLREISRALGTTEEAARKRIDRALGKLRTLLSRRGLVPALGVLTLLMQQKASAAPSAAIARRITSGAWERVEGAVLHGVATLPWWRQRRTAGAAAAVGLAVLLGLGWRSDFFTGDPPQRARAASTMALSPGAPRAALEDFPPVALTVTLMMLPEKEVAPFFLDYVPGSDDAAIYSQLLPRAAALQNAVPPEDAFATTGHPLVVLTGSARPSRAAFSKAPASPATEDPFGEPAVRRRPSISVRHSSKYEYPTEFDPPDAQGRIQPSAFGFRYMGTLFDADISPPDADGNMLMTCSLDFMYAPPEQEVFAALPLTDGAGTAGDTSMHQPVFRSTQWILETMKVPANKVLLAGMMNLPVQILPASDRGPRRMLVFLEINP